MAEPNEFSMLLITCAPNAIREMPPTSIAPYRTSMSTPAFEAAYIPEVLNVAWALCDITEEHTMMEQLSPLFAIAGIFGTKEEAASRVYELKGYEFLHKKYHRSKCQNAWQCTMASRGKDGELLCSPLLKLLPPPPPK